MRKLITTLIAAAFAVTTFAAAAQALAPADAPKGETPKAEKKAKKAGKSKKAAPKKKAATKKKAPAQKKTSKAAESTDKK
jgi:Ni/Co efflux regulator RcnB